MFGVRGKYITKPKYIRSCHGTEYAVELFDPVGESREKGAHINLINIWKGFEPPVGLFKSAKNIFNIN